MTPIDAIGAVLADVDAVALGVGGTFAVGVVPPHATTINKTFRMRRY
jgi:hypothetical protein